VVKPSKRIAAITGNGSDGWGVFYKARSMMAQGIHITELTIGEHDIRTDPLILEAMYDAAKGGATGYALITGIPELRAEVATRITAQTGVETTSKNVMITPGGQAGLFAAHMAACDPGDIGVFIDPYYATYPTTLRAASVTPFAISAHAENAFCPTYGDLNTAPAGAKSLLVNSPNNPTGTIYDDKTMNDIARFVRERDMWLVSDEVYDTQIWEGRHTSFRAMEGMAERTMVVGSLSKSHAMTGSRLGWVIAPEHMIEMINDLATNTTYGVAGFVQHAGLCALRLGPEFEVQIAAPFRRRRDIALNILRDFQDIGAVPPKGAMYMMLDLRKTGLSGEEFALRLLDERHIAVMPGESFGQAAAGHIRVALTIADDAFAIAFREVCKFAQDLIDG
jgi:arginine:pyruvate transaminase